MKYYLFLDLYLAREASSIKSSNPRDKYEFWKDGCWVQDKDNSLCLCDAMHDYEPYRVMDYKEITEQQAMEIIAKQSAGRKE